MEMHQVRYFLAVARHLNFTRAADECNVSQPSLTRAIKLLEYELGGDLIRRERGLSHLTDLGERMLPLLLRCYESATSAKAIAAAMRERKVAALRLGLADGIDVSPFMPALMEMLRAFGDLALRILRGSTADTLEALREGHADLAIASPSEAGWERFEAWPLFREPLALAFAKQHRFSNNAHVTAAELQGEAIILRRHCETTSAVEERLRAHGLDLAFCLEAASDRDVIELVDRGAGIAVMPASTGLPSSIRTVPIAGLDLMRDVAVVAVQGRQRSAAAAMLLTLLRAAEWPDYAEPASTGAARPGTEPMRASA